jgi:hypothetical protein
MASLSLERALWGPIFEITPTQVSSFGIKLSQLDAEEWLTLWTATANLKMQEITPKFSRLFSTAILRNCPGRAFDRFITKVDEAICTAEDKYAEKTGLCHSGDCMTKQDRRRMVAYLMGAGSGKREAICYQTIDVPLPISRKEGLRTRGDRPILVIAEGDKVRARVLENDGQLRKKILVFGASTKKTRSVHSKFTATISAAVR